MEENKGKKLAEEFLKKARARQQQEKMKSNKSEQNEIKINVRKEKKESYLTPKKVLSKGEFEKYKSLRQQLEKRKLREKIKEFEKKAKYERKLAKYSATPTGRVANIIRKGYEVSRSKGGFTQLLYNKTLSPERKKQLMQVRRFKSIQRPIMQGQIPIYKTPEQIFYDYVFNAGDMITPQLEKEVYGFEMNFGDRMSKTTEFDVMNFANVLNFGISPVAQIKKETLHHAHLQHISPVLDVEKEANIFGNIIP